MNQDHLDEVLGEHNRKFTSSVRIGANFDINHTETMRLNACLNSLISLLKMISPSMPESLNIKYYSTSRQ